ncbi:MAG: pilus assembly protein CpaE [Myxococcota bacterium]|jgi:pilus assembly protein CpaE
MGLVRETLAAEAVLPNSSISFGDAISAVKRQRPDVVIVGFHQAMDAALALAQALAKEAPNVTMVAMADQSNAEAILAAMRVGYKEFIVLPDDASRLRQVVHDAAYAPDDDDEKGLVVAVIGSKGGIGSTLICTHLAAEMAAIHRVILLDLDFAMGDAASMMDVVPKDTLHDLLPRADRVDERMLTGSVVVHRSKVHVLAQPNDIDKVEESNPDDIYMVINAAAKGYQYVLMDIGSYVDAGAEMALSVSDIIILVTAPDVISVRNAFRRLKLMERLGIEKERIRLVVNRQSKSSFVPLSDIEGNLGIRIAATIVDDSRTVETAINEGKLVRDINRKSEVAENISSLVAMLTSGFEGDDDDAPPQEPSGGFFSTLFGRG